MQLEVTVFDVNQVHPNDPVYSVAASAPGVHLMWETRNPPKRGDVLYVEVSTVAWTGSTTMFHGMTCPYGDLVHTQTVVYEPKGCTCDR